MYIVRTGLNARLDAGNLLYDKDWHSALVGWVLINQASGVDVLVKKATRLQCVSTENIFQLAEYGVLKADSDY